MEILRSDEQNWVDDIMQKTTDLNTDQESFLWNQQSIYRVPTCLTDLNRKAYKPQVVSFGPYHHGEDHLKSMEQHKLRALLQILKRSRKHVQEFLKALREVEQQLKDCYEQLEEPWINDSGQFSLLMLRDGCFMLEILRTAAAGKSDDEDSLDTHFHGGYAYNDPIFSSHGKLYWLPFICRDMLMIENQLPMLVLEKLVGIETGKAQSHGWINRSVLRLWSRQSLAQDRSFTHVLDVFRDSFIRISSHPSSVLQLSESGAAKIVPSATELVESGVRFKKSKTDRFTDVNFHDGFLSLPAIVIDDATESKLLNLMVYERSHVGTGSDVTSYVFLMDHLIDVAHDVSILRSEGIVENALGSDEAVARLFNGLTVEVTLDPNSGLHEVQHMVNKYCMRRWNVWRANLMHTYFTSPWAVLSLLAASLLLILTVMQTLYAVLSYGH